ncbi:DNA glycosylase [Thozetella sp. PMI_491]|nr:DNA glycosylase [Thozetella sp. PMI_491]
MVITGLAIRANLAVKVNVEVIATMIHVKDPDFKPRVIRGASNLYGLTIGRSPYPHRIAPTPEACEEVHRILTEIHGEVRQPEMVPSPSLEVAGCGEVPSVLDALLRTLISGNTLMARADAAIQNLAQKYGIVEAGMVGAGSINWEKVRLSSLEELVDTIKPAGCARVKGAHIKAILDMVCEENLAHAQARVQDESIEKSQLEQALSLDHMHSMNKDEAMAAFLRYPGIGVKTAACVILFCLRIPCFAVDTHVHKFSQWLGWVPAKASELDSYNHGEFKVPDHLKYGLHQLFIRHGQECYKCRKATRPGTEEWSDAPECPLEHLLNRRKIEVAASEAIGKKSKSKKHKAPDTDQSGEDEDTLEDSEEEKI